MKWGHAGSTGLDFTSVPIVDAHFAACADAYVSMALSVDFPVGGNILDAGCGSGSFLPVLATSAGSLTALDLAPDAVSTVDLPCPVEVVGGDVRRLPFEDDTFDGVWCANMTQYLDDDGLAAALSEFARVVRPGGVVAVKDLDATLVTVQPGDPFAFADFFRAAASTTPYARQLLRARSLHRWLAAAGLVSVRQRTVLIEHYAPFSAEMRAFYDESCATLARQALALGMPEDWAAFLDPASTPLNDPHAYLCEGNVLAMGCVG